MNGSVLGPYNTTTATTLTLSAVFTDYTQTLSSATILLTTGSTVTHQWNYSPTFNYENGGVVTKQETYTFGVPGTYVMASSASNAHGVGASAPIDIVVAGPVGTSFSKMEITGSTANGIANATEARWKVSTNTVITVTVNWGRAASPSDPVYISGPNVTLTGGETSYSSTLLYPSSTSWYSVAVYRSLFYLDDVRIEVARQSGGIMTRGSGKSLNLPSYITAGKFTGLSGEYQYKRRNCTPDTLPVDDTSGTLVSSEKQIDTLATSTAAIGYVELCSTTDTLETPVLYPTQAYQIIPITDASGYCSFDYMSALYEAEIFSTSNRGAYNYLRDDAVCSHGILGTPLIGSYFQTQTPCVQ